MASQSQSVDPFFFFLPLFSLYVLFWWLKKQRDTNPGKRVPAADRLKTHIKPATLGRNLLMKKGRDEGGGGKKLSLSSLLGID